MRKEALKFVSKFLERPIVKIIVYILGIVFIFFIYGVFDDSSQMFGKILEMLRSEVTLSVFFAGLLSVIMAKIIKQCDCYLEESLKLEDNHHKIIIKYNGHDQAEIPGEGNYADKVGTYMKLRENHITTLHESDLKNTENDIYSNEYKEMAGAIEGFQAGTLYMPTVSVFANINGKTKLKFEDSSQIHELPEFIVENAMRLMEAHKNSTKNNNDTVRLNDFSYDDATNELTFYTERSRYFHMLMTNRCMDYQFYDDMTLRKIYEYGKQITPLKESVFGNQIGINGLVISKDGYVLIEKRDHHKTTWKNKFAQSISLALKESDLKLKKGAILKNTPEEATEKLRNIIYKTLKDNFGLTADDLEEFSIETNFLGLARDILEGGKPNIYFYVVTKANAKELADLLAKNAGKDNKSGNALKTEKLSSDYYLVPYKDIKITFKYVLQIDRRQCYRIRRKVSPRVSKRIATQEKVRHYLGIKFAPIYARECGEALLATLSYLELCEKRIDAINEK